ncbi:MAG TPA: hypothetical protein VGQ06_05010 [Gemmatimonadales bacterium]|jgi:hypothetical protein|nr:hypothetical protein [Gemmatimonadales bacterium]
MGTRILLLAVGLATVSCAPPRRNAPLTPLPQTRLGAADLFGPGIVAASGRSVEFQLARGGHVILLHVSGDGVDLIAPLHSRDRTHFAAGAHWISRPPLAASVPAAPAVNPSLADDYQMCQVRTEIVALRTAQPELRDSLGRVLVPASPPGVPGVGASVRCMYRGTGQPWYSRAASARAPAGQLETTRAYWLLIVSDVKTKAADVRRLAAGVAVDDDDVASALATIPEAVVGGRTRNWAAYSIPVPQ